MTNREYQRKQHRGSSPSRNVEKNFVNINSGQLPSEEWKNLTWYPFSSEPLNKLRKNGTQHPDT
jgi:hypothetical protein